MCSSCKGVRLWMALGGFLICGVMCSPVWFREKPGSKGSPVGSGVNLVWCVAFGGLGLVSVPVEMLR